MATKEQQGVQVSDQNVQSEFKQRKKTFERELQEGSELERQADGGLIDQRLYEQQEKQQNKVRLLRGEAGLESNYSRSTSRRDRRSGTRRSVNDGKHMKTSSNAALKEADARGETTTMQPFERIGPDSTSMGGPVTHSQAMRGEVPVRGSNPKQPYYMPQNQEKGGNMKNTDGLKLTLEANLEIEIELKASIRGDITLSLL